MKHLIDIINYLKNKKFVRKFESNPRNYDRGILLATSEYCNAVTDVELYKNS